MSIKFIFYLAVIALLIAACAELPAEDLDTTPLPASGEGETGEGLTVEGTSSTPIRMSLSMPAAPALGETVEITLNINSVEDAPDTSVVLRLPEGAVLVLGQTDWQVDLSPGKSATLKSEIRFEETGQFLVEAYALKDIGGGTVWGDSTEIFLTIGDTESTFGWEQGEVEDKLHPSGEESGEGDDAEVKLETECPDESRDDCPEEDDRKRTTCPPPSSEPALPISVTLDVPQDLTADAPVEVTFTVCSVEDAPNTTAYLELPDGVDLLSGELSWELSLSPNDPVAFSVVIQFTKSGTFNLAGSAFYDLGDGTVWGDRMDVFVTIE